MPLLFFILLFFHAGDVTIQKSVVEWITPTHYDFGKLVPGKPASHSFRFKNTSEEPLSIDNVRSSCGCTASEWEEEIVMPGEESTIQIEYDSHKSGYFRKKIAVYFSTQRKAEKLSIEGYVE